MVKVIEKKNIFQKFADDVKNLGPKNSIQIIIFFVLSAGLAVTLYQVKVNQDIRQKAASPHKTATISIIPESGSYLPGQPFTAKVVIDGGGQVFNAAQATVVLSNLTVQDLKINSPEEDGCNFVFVRENRTPTVSNPSFAGGILKNFSSRCTLYTVTLVSNSQGVGSFSFTKASVKAYSNSGEILYATYAGSYNFSTISPTDVPSSTPEPVTPTPTQDVPSPTPTVTPAPLDPPTVDQYPPQTYLTAITLTGTKPPFVTTVYVNNNSNGTSYPSSTTWEYPVNLSLGGNTFTIHGSDSLGNTTSTVSIFISLHKISDINGDGVVDLTDLSMFATDWENTETLNYVLSDMDNDGLVDLTDFSILVRNYED